MNREEFRILPDSEGDVSGLHGGQGRAPDEMEITGWHTFFVGLALGILAGMAAWKFLVTK